MRNFWLFTALALLSSCGSAPQFPDGMFCISVWNRTLGGSYAKCEQWSDPEVTAVLGSDAVFKKKMILVELEYFNEIMTWKGDMEKWGRKHCR